MSEPLILIDADVLISAKNRYYAFGICPGFWDSLRHHFEEGDIHSIDRVRNELLAGRDTEDLYLWVKDLPSACFLDTTQAEIIRAYEDVMLWVQRHTRYLDRAKAKFATEADGWLVACSMAGSGIVVTNEQPRPESRNRILLPDVCSHFDVPYEDTFDLLERLEVAFHWHRE